jgi:hypothetical protein
MTMTDEASSQIPAWNLAIRRKNLAVRPVSYEHVPDGRCSEPGVRRKRANLVEAWSDARLCEAGYGCRELSHKLPALTKDELALVMP